MLRIPRGTGDRGDFGRDIRGGGRGAGSTAITAGAQAEAQLGALAGGRVAGVVERAVELQRDVDKVFVFVDVDDFDQAGGRLGDGECWGQSWAQCRGLRVCEGGGAEGAEGEECEVCMWGREGLARCDRVSRHEGVPGRYATSRRSDKSGCDRMSRHNSSPDDGGIPINGTHRRSLCVGYWAPRVLLRALVRPGLASQRARRAARSSLDSGGSSSSRGLSRGGSRPYPSR